MAGALLVSLKPPVLMKGKNYDQKRKNVPQGHKNPGPGTQMVCNIKGLYLGMGYNIKKHQRVSANAFFRVLLNKDRK